MLELLGRLAAHHQLVLVTADDEVLAWARLEAMAGTIGAIVSAPPAVTRPAERGAVETTRDALAPPQCRERQPVALRP